MFQEEIAMQGGRVVLILDTLKPGEIIRPLRHAEQIEKVTDIYFSLTLY